MRNSGGVVLYELPASVAPFRTAAGRPATFKMGSIPRIAIGAALGAVGGLALGTCLGLTAGLGVCVRFDEGYGWVGVLFGAGVGAAIAVAKRPDPRACNLQDPPDLLRGEEAAGRRDSGS